MRLRSVLLLPIALCAACPESSEWDRELATSDASGPVSPATSVNSEAEPEPEPIAAENLRSTELVVEGMTCSGCEYNVASGLKLLQGVASATADAKKGRAYVEYDVTRVSVEDLAGAVTQAGYPAEALPGSSSGLAD